MTSAKEEGITPYGISSVVLVSSLPVICFIVAVTEIFGTDDKIRDITWYCLWEVSRCLCAVPGMCFVLIFLVLVILLVVVP